MDTVKVNITSFDSENNNLLVNFSCEYNGETINTDTYNFAISNLDHGSEESLTRNLAHIGEGYLKHIINNLDIKRDPVKIDMLSNLVNKDIIVKIENNLHTEEELSKGKDLEIEL